MAYNELREFLKLLEEKDILKRIKAEVDPVLEIAEINDRVVKAGGPALLFENPMINVFRAIQEKSCMRDR